MAEPLECSVLVKGHLATKYWHVISLDCKTQKRILLLLYTSIENLLQTSSLRLGSICSIPFCGRDMWVGRGLESKEMPFCNAENRGCCCWPALPVPHLELPASLPCARPAAIDSVCQAPYWPDTLAVRPKRILSPVAAYLGHTMCREQLAIQRGAKTFPLWARAEEVGVLTC